ncbi:unnamed protein product [Durusdinium trenchii]|uniref:Sugar phosphate transporter domain-containing protein n=1 Tax=Durusdinium trenchii TaxID=1381693 RepID=A0ABP0NTZ0_9DINO
MILIAVSPIAYYEGPQALLMVISYLSAVTLVKVFVKETINLGYPYPNTLTAMHMLAVCLVTLIFERPKMDEALKVLPISVLNGLSLLTNNTAFLYGGVAFVSMIAANVPFMTFSLELIKGKRSFNFASAFSVGMVCGGSICCIQGEVNASLAAFIWATISALLRSARGVWQHELVSLSLSPLRLVFWNGFWSGCITLVTMVASGECLEGLMILPTIGAEVQVALLNSILAAVCLNITQWYAMKALGALMSSTLATWQYVGVLLLATGTFTNKMQGFCQRHDEVQALRLAAEQRKKDLQALLQQDEEERGESFGTLHARLQCAEASKEALEVQLASITSHAERLAFEREDLLCRLNEDRALLPVFVKPSRRPSERSLRRLRQTTGFTFVVLLLLAICAYVKALHVIDLGHWADPRRERDTSSGSGKPDRL